MSTAVMLVETYLRLNGYFTVCEYPVIEPVESGGFRESTDLDVLAFRFAGAGRTAPGHPGFGPIEPDPALATPADAGDMLICEVKEGRARLNPAMREPAVLMAAMVRFGCCAPDEAEQVATRLLTRGRAATTHGHAVRFVTFGSEVRRRGRSNVSLTLEHVVRFIEDQLEGHWEALRHSQFRDPALAFLAVRRKAVTAGARDQEV